MSDRRGGVRLFAALAGLGFLGWCVLLGAQGQTVPKVRFDPDWPKPLPNKWKLGGITGLAVDKDDNVWVLNRPGDATPDELQAELDPPIADCCVRPPSMIQIDKSGNVIGSFNPPQGQGMAVDSKGFVYIGQDTVRKYDPKTGNVLGEAPRAPERPPGGAPPSDPAARAAREAAIAAFRAKHPPTTPRIVGIIEEVRLDEAAREPYAADSYLGGRVMVFDLDTFQFKRGWGAYGRALSEISTHDADRAYTPGGPMPKEFRGHLTLNISNDGFVYAADRAANRIHVTTKQGKFVKELVLAPLSGDNGSTGGVMFSPDKQQQFLYISDMQNNHVWFLNREDGRVVGQVGSMGENGGQFNGLHMIAVDSKGNLYTGEVRAGERVQRFVPVP